MFSRIMVAVGIAGIIGYGSVQPVPRGTDIYGFVSLRNNQSSVEEFQPRESVRVGRTLIPVSLQK